MLKQLQVLSGSVFSIFLCLHFVAAISAPLGIDQFNHIQSLTKAVYRPSLAVEIALVWGPLLLHMVSNSLIIMQRKSKLQNGAKKGESISLLQSIKLSNGPLPLLAKVNRYTGYALSCLVLLHAFGTRVAPAMKGFEIDFGAMSFSMQKKAAFLYPYFAIYVFSGAYHMMYGLCFFLLAPITASSKGLKALVKSVFLVLVPLIYVATIFGVITIHGKGPVDVSGIDLSKYAALE